MALLGLSETNDSEGASVSCENILEIEEGAMHSSCVEKNGCDCWV